jgi:hypothetical protein
VVYGGNHHPERPQYRAPPPETTGRSWSQKATFGHIPVVTVNMRVVVRIILGDI